MYIANTFGLSRYLSTNRNKNGILHYLSEIYSTVLAKSIAIAGSS